MIVKTLRKKTQMHLDWISKVLYMGIRSSVTRAKKVLAEKNGNGQRFEKNVEKSKYASDFLLDPLLKKPRMTSRMPC